ncbi:type II secretion system F family protein [Blautia wexlerae]|nr:type II secretion system F family protein [Blautia wexlerae]
MRCDSTNVDTCCHFCYDPVCTDRLEKGWIPSSGIGGKDGIRLFAVVAIAGNLLGMILTLQNGGQVYPQGYRLEKEDTGSYEKEFMVSVDGEEPVSMYIQVPEKELEEQEEEPKQNKKLTRKEQAQKSIAEAVSRYNEQRSDPDYYYLPDKLNGKKVKWESPADTSGMLLTGLFLIAAMAILVMKGREEQVQLQKRYEELLMDYPGLIMKFTLLVQAGMTVRKAFQKISLDYGRKRKRNPRPAYEEIRIVCYEMESGVSESEAYRRFGERCGQVKYKTFATLLIQNLQKGSRQMADMLERESTEAWEERKRKARVLGEAAATKLLVPMIMMLIVVMAIVMIPAFMSFYGET